MEDKIGAVFGIFDFDSSGSISPDEATILVISVLRALTLIQGGEVRNDMSDEDKIEAKVFEAFGQEDPIQLNKFGYRRSLRNPDMFLAHGRPGRVWRVSRPGLKWTHNVATNGRALAFLHVWMKPVATTRIITGIAQSELTFNT